MTKIDPKIINEIAELIDCGNVCFYNIKDKSIEYYPDSLDLTLDSMYWEETIEKIEDNFDDFIKIQKMDSSQSFQVMVDFTNLIDSIDLKHQLLTQLNRPKPFRNFKNIVELSEYREKWFQFKHEKNVEWVMGQFT